MFLRKICAKEEKSIKVFKEKQKQPALVVFWLGVREILRPALGGTQNDKMG
jgi:hypothetical protein